jgi:WhiB family redox-sensing transcriptional regulator
VSWKALGSCRDHPEVDFFPDHDRWGEQRAKAVCVECPVRAECMDYAITNREVGVWGGTTESERRRIEDRYVRPKSALALRKDLAVTVASV